MQGKCIKVKAISLESTIAASKLLMRGCDDEKTTLQGSQTQPPPTLKFL